MEHTKEPWNVKREYNSIISIVDSDGFIIGNVTAYVRSSILTGNAEGDDNARRIVACVNACAGFSIEELEGASLFADSFAAQNKIDDLLAALKKIIDFGDYTAPEGMKRIAIDAVINASK